VESASQRYFSVAAAQLNYLQAATIAGITQSPTYYDPLKNPANAEGRRNIVLRLMKEQGYITQEEYDAGIATPLTSTLFPTETRSGCMAAATVVAGSGFFCDYVTRVIRNDEAFGATPDEREELLYRGGLTITTTLDTRLQTIADAEVKGSIPVNDPEGVGEAMSVVEPGTGQIKAMAQNRDYNNSSDAGDRQTSVNYNASFAYGGSSGFAPGSTFKPFTLLEWLRQGHSLNERVNGSVRTLNLRDFTACGQPYAGGTWSPGNSEGGASASMTIMDATRNSVNLAYLSMAQQLDLCNVMQGAADLGVVKAGGGAGDGNFDARPSVVLGSDSTTPLALAGAYAAFASGGIYCEPIAITSVRDADGAELPIPSANCEQKIDTETANAMNYALSNVFNGTGKGIGKPSYPASGKTGTTTENEYTWFAGYTPRLATVVWVGNPSEMTPIRDMFINGKKVGRVFGATIAGPTWKKFMDQALDDGQPNPGFADPSTEDVFGKPIPVPAVIGLDETAARTALEAAGFTVTIGTPVDSTSPAGIVVTQDPSGTAVAGSAITLALSTGIAPATTTDPNAAQGGQTGGGQGGGNGNNGQGGGNGNQGNG
jgi:membrane peptidoglycan carboxypeptidase